VDVLFDVMMQREKCIINSFQHKFKRDFDGGSNVYTCILLVRYRRKNTSILLCKFLNNSVTVGSSGSWSVSQLLVVGFVEESKIMCNIYIIYSK